MLTTLFKRNIYNANEFDPNFFIPEPLLKDPHFKKMSGNVYCEFTIHELMELLQRSESATINIKKQLIKYGLLEQEYVIGLPSRLYIKEP